jgi:NAD(P)-dependent dehydrogenase (short-subunit alcohol dehydrogenase family)
VSFYLIRKYFGGTWCKDRVDLTNKVVIITGANTGIGIETAKELAKMNGHIILAGRSSQKTRDAVKIIKDYSSNQKVEAIELDLSSLSSVRSFVDKFKAKNLPLHILINNAGVNGGATRRTTSDGFELFFGVNHLGHFLLTNLLLDKLKETKGRIVNLSSRLHFRGKIDFDDLQSEKTPWNSMQVYGNTKLMNVSFTFELQKRLEGTGVESFAVHPGVIFTELHRDDSGGFRVFLRLLTSIFGKNTIQGAQTSIYAAISPSVKGKGGSYLADCAVTKPLPQGHDPVISKKLWDISANLVGLQN